MKRGREDNKVMGPLFPRLHVNDADKGGPRAPPRNKMALYEQLSIPSQRFTSGAAPSLPLLPHHASGLVPSASSNQGCGHEMSLFSPFYVPSHMAAHATERACNHLTGGLNPNTMRTGLEKMLHKHVSQRMVHTAGNEHAGAECSSLRQRGLSGAKESSEKLEGNDDFRVPTLVQTGTARHSEKVHHLMSREIRTHFHSDSVQKNGKSIKSPTAVQNSDGKSLEQQSTIFLTSQQHERSIGEGKTREVPVHIKRTENMSQPTSREKAAAPSNLSTSSSNQQCRTASLHRESSGTFVGPRHLDTELMGKQGMSNGRSGSCSQMPLGNCHRGAYVAENGNASCDDKVAAMGKDVWGHGSTGGADKISLSGDAAEHHSLGDTDKNDDDSETSIVDSISDVGISPDDVVGVIGPKHFWKARRAIVNQQRVFALQVFELHRLIKVQKLIAESPHLLLEENSYLHGSPPKAPVKDPHVNSFAKPQHVDKEKEESCKVNRNNECPEENVAGNPSLHEDNNSEEPAGQLQRDGLCYGDLPSSPVSSDNKPWSFPLPGNQWLIPVMSPTEGLIYKPYTGPCPPPGAFMAPVYGGCSTLSVPPGAGDFINPAYGVPTSHKQQSMGVLPGSPAVAPNFFPTPFGLPVVNPLASSTAVEQLSSLAGPWPSSRKESQPRSSCCMSHPKNEALSERARKVQIAKDSDLHVSTVDSPIGRVKEGRDAQSLIPMASAMECPSQPPQSHRRDHQPRVIKVVPHNRRTATESAVRIFQSIQKERQRHDSV